VECLDYNPFTGDNYILSEEYATERRVMGCIDERVRQCHKRPSAPPMDDERDNIMDDGAEESRHRELNSR
jgi:hypothetical protein